jgi:hypothetical protein
VNGTFPGGASQYPWFDINRVGHIFPSIDKFQEWATKIEDYVSALDMIIVTAEGELPAQPATMS